jgi:hypothetical protein
VFVIVWDTTIALMLLVLASLMRCRQRCVYLYTCVLAIG